MIWLSTALAATWTIDPAPGAGDFTTIEEAVSSPVLANGDTLVLVPGTHIGADLTLNPLDLTLQGSGGFTVLQPPTAGGPVLRSRNNNLTVLDLTIDGGTFGPGIEMTESGSLLLERLLITNTDGALGGGLYAQGLVEVTATDVTFENNMAEEGAGVALDNGASFFGNNLTFTNNQAIQRDGGAMWIGDGSDVQLFGSTFEANAGQKGGAIRSRGMLLVQSSTFVENSAIEGGAIAAQNSTGPTTIFDSHFSANLADNRGGALSGESFTVRTTVFDYNQANVGGAIDIPGGTGFVDTFENVAFCYNNAQQRAQAMDVDNGTTLQMRNVLFAHHNGGAGNTLETRGVFQGEYLTFVDNALPIAMRANSQTMLRYSIFADAGLDGGGGAGGSIVDNVFHPSAEIQGADQAQQIIADPGIPASFACLPGLSYPYPTAPATFDIGVGDVDLDGTASDAGHLGSTTVDVDFWVADSDGDQALVSRDCDDNDALRSPFFSEVCNGIDDDCNVLVDDGVTETRYADSDGDSYGNPDQPADVCPSTPGYVTNAQDCNDDDSNIRPGVPDNTCDLVDNDCDGSVDEDAGASSWYADVDGDGFGDPSSDPITSCIVPPGTSANDLDCNDNDALINPTAPEVCNGIDDDCDDQTDEGVASQFYTDGDGDGFGTGTVIDACVQPSGTATTDGDCNDGNPAVFPGATEVCNGTDDDCDNQTDEGVLSQFFTDSDGDSFGTGAAIDACTQPSGTASATGDCNDGDPAVFPGATEVCNGTDDDCDGTPDDGLATQTWYTDSDGDGYGDAAAGDDCAPLPGTSALDGDCNDGNPSVHPDAIEQCDNIDNDCNGSIDDGVAETDWYTDSDGDGYGTGTPISDCAQPSGTSPLNGDCDDANPNFNPGAPEICDNQDNDCNNTIDDGLVFDNWYPDIDGDGYGAGTPVASCTNLNGHSLDSSDCNDGDPDISPDADEICDSIDNDCDGLTDDDDDLVIGAPSWWDDADDDSFGDDASAVQSCVQPPATANRGGDCNDTDPNIYAGAPEACIDGKDNDCDGLTDDEDPDFVFGGVEYGNDADDDGFGDPQAIEVACTGAQSPGYVPMSLGEDCDDANPSAFPGFPEVCDNIDNDCNGSADEGLAFQDFYPDADGDFFGDPYLPPVNACIRPEGRVSNGLDCDDDDPDRNPNANEICDGIDQDCDLQIDEDLPTQNYYPDVDQDGFGDADATPEASCSPIDDLVLDSRDCDDTDADVNPSAFDDPIDGFDANCDGVIEEIPVEPYEDSDGDGVVDIADGNPAQAGGAQTVSPPAPEYGCGCSVGGPSWTVVFLPVLAALRRR